MCEQTVHKLADDIIGDDIAYLVDKLVSSGNYVEVVNSINESLTDDKDSRTWNTMSVIVAMLISKYHSNTGEAE